MPSGDGKASGRSKWLSADTVVNLVMTAIAISLASQGLWIAAVATWIIGVVVAVVVLTRRGRSSRGERP